MNQKIASFVKIKIPTFIIARESLSEYTLMGANMGV